MLSTASVSGQGLVEYALIILLIALVVILAAELFGITLRDTFELINTRISEL